MTVYKWTGMKVWVSICIRLTARLHTRRVVILTKKRKLALYHALTTIIFTALIIKNRSAWQRLLCQPVVAQTCPARGASKRSKDLRWRRKQKIILSLSLYCRRNPRSLRSKSINQWQVDGNPWVPGILSYLWELRRQLRYAKSRAREAARYLTSLKEMSNRVRWLRMMTALIVALLIQSYPRWTKSCIQLRARLTLLSTSRG